jgi:FKBP-type peptidyl-prolyl cis-trans isomerase
MVMTGTKHTRVCVFISLLAFAAGCVGDKGSGKTGPVELEEEMDRVSYSIGYQIGQNLKDSFITDINVDIMARGIQDVMGGVDPAIPPERMQEVMQAFAKTQQERQMAEQARQQTENLVVASKFLAENAVKEGVVTLPDSLQYIVLEKGAGAVPDSTATVRVHYAGTFIDGTPFDSSIERGEPAEFPVNRVIPGWTRVLTQMQVGEKRRVFIPPALGYGAAGYGNIQPNKLLIFEIQLLEIVKNSQN